MWTNEAQVELPCAANENIAVIDELEARPLG
jgi:hypothetical protein